MIRTVNFDSKVYNALRFGIMLSLIAIIWRADERLKEFHGVRMEGAKKHYRNLS